ncbi:MAG: acyl-ACP--UDP-N-acetylglucosamine O-acyltransferase [Phycisphaerales bacterium]
MPDGVHAHATIHPTAVIHPSVEIGAGVEIGPYCVIGADVRLGKGTVLHNHVTVLGPAVIGEENVVYPYAVLGAEPQDLKYAGHDTSLRIGDRNKIREHVTIHRGTEFGGGQTRIGSDCLIMVGVHIAHDCQIEDEVVIANNSMLGGHCLIEEGATIAGGVGIHHFTTVSRLSFVAGMARVTRDVPPFTIVEGSPAEPRKINTTGLIRRGWSNEEIEVLRRAFRKLLRSPEVPFRDAIEEFSDAKREFSSVAELCRFVERAEDGVHGRYLESQRDSRNPRR